ncbi:MAG: hypothetical protein GY832_11730 [Chloroflexi bacterium]|nr:hypothetical protein [Chloroflexota bacterium]
MYTPEIDDQFDAIDRETGKRHRMNPFTAVEIRVGQNTHRGYTTITALGCEQGSGEDPEYEIASRYWRWRPHKNPTIVLTSADDMV